MTHTRGLRFRSAGVAILGFALLASVLAVPLASVHGMGNEKAMPETSACTALIAESPSINSTLFLKVCAEPAFQDAYQLAGTGNFTYGVGGGPNGSFQIWEFSWEAACTNSTLKGQSCTFGEYWVGYPSNGTINGPFTTQHEAVCACGSNPPGPSLASELVVPGAFLIAGATVGVCAAISAKRLKNQPRQPKT